MSEIRLSECLRFTKGKLHRVIFYSVSIVMIICRVKDLQCCWLNASDKLGSKSICEFAFLFDYYCNTVLQHEASKRIG